MRHSHLLALSVAVFLTGALYTVVGGDPTPSPLREPHRVAALENDSPSTDPPEVFSAGASVLSAVAKQPQVPPISEVALVAGSITSTTVAPTTTTTVPAKSSNDSASGSNGSTNTTASPPPPPPPPSSSAGYRSDLESSFRSKINGLRGANGLAALSSSGSLNSRARDWAKTMANSGELKHSNLSSLLGTWTVAGENVGKGGSVSAIFGSLKASSGHLQNMLGNYTHLGVGVWMDGSGTLWTVHVFTR